MTMPALPEARTGAGTSTRWLRGAQQVLGREGVRGLLRRGVRRLWLHERYFVYVRRLTEQTAPLLAAGLTAVRRADRQEWARLADSPTDFGPAQYWDVMDPTADCYLGWAGDRVVGVHWVSATHETNGLVDLEPGDCVIGPCATSPNDRGRGIYPMMLAHICADRQRRGARRAFMVVNVNNQSSIRGIEKAGFLRANTVTLTRLLGWQRVRSGHETRSVP